MKNIDALSEVYSLLYNARIHNSNTFGTPEECDAIREMVYCGAYKAAAKFISRIKGGRGGGQLKRNLAIEYLQTLYMPKIVKVYLGKTDIAERSLEAFMLEHPECEQFHGDMRKCKVNCKTIYRLYVYDPATRVNTYKMVFIERS